MCTGSRSGPRQGLPGVRQDPSLFILLPFKNKVLTEKTRPRQEKLAGKDKTPARGACREGQPRHFRKLAATHRASRQDPTSGKLAGATRQRPRQGACRGEATTLRPRSSASDDVSPQDRSWCTWRVAVQPSGARWQVKMTRRPSWRSVAPLTVVSCTVWATGRALNALVPCRQS